MKYSIELVPRSIDQLKSELQTVAYFKQIKYINIPDLKRFTIRSWEPSELIAENNYDFIPHFRAIDFDINNLSNLENIISKYNLNTILLITGDPPQDMKFEVFPTSTIKLGLKLKTKFNNLKIYGAIDPYRNNIRSEFDYLNQKIDHGFDGFFSQPFFDLRLLEIYLEHYENTEIFWGISPVTTLRSKYYWETRNRASFPKAFKPTLEWNINFAKKAKEYLNNQKQNIYFMPIKTNIKDYLNGVFSS